MTDAERPDDKNIAPKKDDELRVSVEAKFRHLSVENPQDLHPIEPFSKDELGWMRRRLIEAGFQVETISEKGKEALRQSMFRAKVTLDESGEVEHTLVFNYDAARGQRWAGLNEFKPEKFSDFVNYKNPSSGDRSLGVYELLGPDKFENLVRESYKIAMDSGYPQRIEDYVGTEGRPIQQAAIDVLQAAVELSQDAGKNLSRRMNHRAFQGARWRWKKNKDALQLLSHNFEGAGEPHKDLRGMPAGAFSKLWEYLNQDGSY